MHLQDVTVREGGQMPGRSYGVDDRVAAAAALDRLGLDYVQVGFAVTGDPDVGEGFGLAVVDEIAAAHGWSVSVTDSADGGARFEFRGVDVANDT